MRFTSSSFILLTGLLISLSLCAGAQNTSPESSSPQPPPGGDFAVENPTAEKVPADVILIKGAEPSASDSSTPVPESGSIHENVYRNRYFGLQYLLGPDWIQKYTGPPPSDSGYYVLTQLQPSKQFKGPSPGTILISAQDLFFSRVPARTALQIVKRRQGLLTADYKLERQPAEVKIAGHTFYRMDYMSPVAELHWYTLTTEIRCHAVEFTMIGQDTALLEALVQKLDKLRTSENPESPAGEPPVCVKDYATGDNVALRVDPVLTDRKFNAIPVRITIDKNGKVKHVHVISAFREQAKAITDALLQWEFKPYKLNGQLVEVETGIMFGGATRGQGRSGTSD
jgi:hypothetical protein